MEKLIQDGRERLYRWRRRLATSIIVALLSITAYYVVFSANGLMVYQQKRQESRELDRQIRALQQQNEAMEQEIKGLKTDPKAIEKEAREHLRYSRPGEVIFTIPAAPAVPAKEKK